MRFATQYLAIRDRNDLLQSFESELSMKDSSRIACFRNKAS